MQPSEHASTYQPHTAAVADIHHSMTQGYHSINGLVQDCVISRVWWWHHLALTPLTWAITACQHTYQPHTAAMADIHHSMTQGYHSINGLVQDCVISRVSWWHHLALTPLIWAITACQHTYQSHTAAKADIHHSMTQGYHSINGLVQDCVISRVSWWHHLALTPLIWAITACQHTYQSHTAAKADIHHSMTQGYHSINGLVQDCVISRVSWWHHLALTPLIWAITACQHTYQSHTAAKADIHHSMTQGYHSINGLVQDCVISRVSWWHHLALTPLIWAITACQHTYQSHTAAMADIHHSMTQGYHSINGLVQDCVISRVSWWHHLALTPLIWAITACQHTYQPHTAAMADIHHSMTQGYHSINGLVQDCVISRVSWWHHLALTPLIWAITACQHTYQSHTAAKADIHHSMTQGYHSINGLVQDCVISRVSWWHHLALTPLIWAITACQHTYQSHTAAKADIHHSMTQGYHSINGLVQDCVISRVSWWHHLALTPLIWAITACQHTYQSHTAAKADIHHSMTQGYHSINGLVQDCVISRVSWWHHLALTPLIWAITACQHTYQSHTAAKADIHHSMTQGYHSINGLVQDCVISRVSWWHHLALTPLIWAITACQHTYQSHTAAKADIHHSMTQGYHSINGLVQDCVISRVSWWHHLALTPLIWAITACQHTYQSHTAAKADIHHSMTQGYHSINGLVQDCVISRVSWWHHLALTPLIWAITACQHTYQSHTAAKADIHHSMTQGYHSINGLVQDCVISRVSWWHHLALTPLIWAITACQHTYQSHTAAKADIHHSMTQGYHSINGLVQDCVISRVSWWHHLALTPLIWAITACQHTYQSHTAAKADIHHSMTQGYHSINGLVQDCVISRVSWWHHLALTPLIWAITACQHTYQSHTAAKADIHYSMTQGYHNINGLVQDCVISRVSWWHHLALTPLIWAITACQHTYQSHTAAKADIHHSMTQGYHSINGLVQDCVISRVSWWHHLALTPLIWAITACQHTYQSHTAAKADIHHSMTQGYHSINGLVQDCVISRVSWWHHLALTPLIWAITACQHTYQSHTAAKADIHHSMTQGYHSINGLVQDCVISRVSWWHHLALTPLIWAITACQHTYQSHTAAKADIHHSMTQGYHSINGLVQDCVISRVSWWHHLALTPLIWAITACQHTYQSHTAAKADIHHSMTQGYHSINGLVQDCVISRVSWWHHLALTPLIWAITACQHTYQSHTAAKADIHHSMTQGYHSINGLVQDCVISRVSWWHHLALTPLIWAITACQHTYQSHTAAKADIHHSMTQGYHSINGLVQDCVISRVSWWHHLALTPLIWAITACQHTYQSHTAAKADIHHSMTQGYHSINGLVQDCVISRVSWWHHLALTPLIWAITACQHTYQSHTAAKADIHHSMTQGYHSINGLVQDCVISRVSWWHHLALTPLIWAITACQHTYQSHTAAKADIHHSMTQGYHSINGLVQDCVISRVSWWHHLALTPLIWAITACQHTYQSHTAAMADIHHSMTQGYHSINGLVQDCVISRVSWWHHLALTPLIWAITACQHTYQPHTAAMADIHHSMTQGYHSINGLVQDCVISRVSWWHHLALTPLIWAITACQHTYQSHTAAKADIHHSMTQGYHSINGLVQDCVISRVSWWHHLALTPLIWAITACQHTYQPHTAAMADIHHSMTQSYHSINGLVQDCVISRVSWWHHLALTPLIWAITACQHTYQSHTAAKADIHHSMTQGYHNINGLVQDCVICRVSWWHHLALTPLIWAITACQHTYQSHTAAKADIHHSMTQGYHSINGLVQDCVISRVSWWHHLALTPLIWAITACQHTYQSHTAAKADIHHSMTQGYHSINGLVQDCVISRVSWWHHLALTPLIWAITACQHTYQSHTAAKADIHHSMTQGYHNINGLVQDCVISRVSWWHHLALTPLIWAITACQHTYQSHTAAKADIHHSMTQGYHSINGLVQDCVISRVSWWHHLALTPLIWAITACQHTYQSHTAAKADIHHSMTQGYHSINGLVQDCVISRVSWWHHLALTPLIWAITACQHTYQSHTAAKADIHHSMTQGYHSINGLVQDCVISRVSWWHHLALTPLIWAITACQHTYQSHTAAKADIHHSMTQGYHSINGLVQDCVISRVSWWHHLALTPLIWAITACQHTYQSHTAAKADIHHSMTQGYHSINGLVQDCVISRVSWWHHLALTPLIWAITACQHTYQSHTAAKADIHHSMTQGYHSINGLVQDCVISRVSWWHHLALTPLIWAITACQHTYQSHTAAKADIHHSMTQGYHNINGLVQDCVISRVSWWHHLALTPLIWAITACQHTYQSHTAAKADIHHSMTQGYHSINGLVQDCVISRVSWWHHLALTPLIWAITACQHTYQSHTAAKADIHHSMTQGYHNINGLVQDCVISRVSWWHHLALTPLIWAITACQHTYQSHTAAKADIHHSMTQGYHNINGLVQDCVISRVSWCFKS